MYVFYSNHFVTPTRVARLTNYCDDHGIKGASIHDVHVHKNFDFLAQEAGSSRSISHYSGQGSPRRARRGSKLTITRFPEIDSVASQKWRAQ